MINNLSSNRNYKVYRYITRITGNTDIPNLLNLDDATAQSDFERAYLFNEYFHSIFMQSSPVITPRIASSTSDLFTRIFISEQDVYTILSTLDTSKATGIDSIGPLILKSCAAFLSKPLHHLFTCCLRQSNIPNEWKIHILVPIYKSGDKTSVKNYKPISILSNIGEVLERIIFNKINDFVTNKLSLSQFGVVKGRSPLQQLLLYIYSYCIFTHQTHKQMSFTSISGKLLTLSLTVNCCSDYILSTTIWAFTCWTFAAGKQDMKGNWI